MLTLWGSAVRDEGLRPKPVVLVIVASVNPVGDDDVAADALEVLEEFQPHSSVHLI